jgi:deoxyribonuclease-4
MPLFGAHMSVAGGLHNAVAASVAHGCQTVQLFTKNANQWEGRPITDGEARTFRRAVADAGLQFPTAHDSYLINLAAPDDALYRKSIDAFTDELERAEALGLSYLVTHPGAHTGSGEDAGLARVVAALDEVHARCAGFRVVVLLELTAGQGTSLGYRFEHLTTILDRVKDASRLGVCFDTCHAFAAGYALTSAEDYVTTFDRFDEVIGLERLKLFHINDSLREFGSRVDRHAGIGLGEIGLEAFRRLVTDARFGALPMILETPKEDAAGNAMDAVNLGILRDLLHRRAKRTRSRSGRRIGQNRVKPNFRPADE